MVYWGKQPRKWYGGLIFCEIISFEIFWMKKSGMVYVQCAREPELIDRSWLNLICGQILIAPENICHHSIAKHQDFSISAHSISITFITYGALHNVLVANYETHWMAVIDQYEKTNHRNRFRNKYTSTLAKYCGENKICV